MTPRSASTPLSTSASRCGGTSRARLNRHPDLGCSKRAIGEDVAVLVEVHRHPLHQAPVARVERGAAVHGEAIVPHHQIADLPLMRVDELFSGGAVVNIIQ